MKLKPTNLDEIAENLYEEIDGVQAEMQEINAEIAKLNAEIATKDREIKEWHSLNIKFISVTLVVSKFFISKEINE